MNDPDPYCPHRETTDADQNGFVICLSCLTALHRPEPLEDLLSKLKG